MPAGTRRGRDPPARPGPGAGLRLRVLDAGGRTIGEAPSAGLRAGAVRFELPRKLGGDLRGRVCLAQGAGGTAAVRGSLTQHGLTIDGRQSPGGITMTYYRPGTESLIALAPVIAQRIGLTRGHFGGAWRGLAILLCFGAGLVAGAWLLIGLARGRAPRRAALLCAAVAALNSFAWGLLTPTFQIPDEPYHLSYVQDLAEHGEPPMPTAERPNRTSDELGLVAARGARLRTQLQPGQTAELERPARRRARRRPGPRAEHATTRAPSRTSRDYPPLYYAALVPVYAATHASGGSTLDAVTPMRVLGGLLAGVTVLALFAFLAELFPGRPAIAAGVALICAYQPVFTWIQAGVNPDALLIPLGAVFFWLLARAWRRGLDVWTAVGLGLAFAASVLTKLSALGLAPGFACALALLAWRERRGRWVAPVVAGALAAAVPIALYLIVNTLVWDRSLLPGGVRSAAAGPAVAAGSHVSGFFSYLWQYVLPPTGSMTNFFGVGWLPKDFWTPMWVGKFGWFDYQFPAAVNHAAFALLRASSRSPRWPRSSSGGGATGRSRCCSRSSPAACAGRSRRPATSCGVQGNTIFEQARYLMPLLALYAFASRSRCRC